MMIFDAIKISRVFMDGPDKPGHDEERDILATLSGVRAADLLFVNKR
jgi:hypothetical protein